MDLRTVKHFIWKQGADLTLQYRIIGAKWWQLVNLYYLYIVVVVVAVVGLWFKTKTKLSMRLDDRFTEIFILDEEDSSNLIMASPSRSCWFKHFREYSIEKLSLKITRDSSGCSLKSDIWSHWLCFVKSLMLLLNVYNVNVSQVVEFIDLLVILAISYWCLLIFYAKA